MDFPKLTLPPRDFTAADSRIAESTPGTFAHKFHTLLSEYDNIKLMATASEYSLDIDKASSVCNTVNEHYQWLREKLDQEMQSFLLEQNGRIDSWPSSISHTVRTSDWAQDDDMVFDYFGTDYISAEGGHIERCPPQRAYQNLYDYREKKPFQKMLAKEEDLKRQVKAGKAHRNPLVFLGLMLGFLYCIFAALSILGEVFFRTGEPLVARLRSIPNTEGVLGFLGGAGLYLLALPVRLFLGIQYFFQGIFSIVIGIVFVMVCLLGAYFFYATLMDRWEMVRLGKKAAAEAKALPTSPEYFQARQDEEDEKNLGPLNEELAEEWHQAWYNWVCKNIPQE